MDDRKLLAHFFLAATFFVVAFFGLAVVVDFFTVRFFSVALAVTLNFDQIRTLRTALLASLTSAVTEAFFTGDFLPDVVVAATAAVAGAVLAIVSVAGTATVLVFFELVDVVLFVLAHFFGTCFLVPDCLDFDLVVPLFNEANLKEPAAPFPLVCTNAPDATALFKLFLYERCMLLYVEFVRRGHTFLNSLKR